MATPLEIIKQDHRKAEDLFKTYEDLDENAFETKEKVVEKIREHLKLHTDMEERIFYPTAREILKREMELMVEEAYTEHGVAKRLLEELSVTHPEDLQFDARVKVLNENLTHHIKEEEEELLPKMEELMSHDELAALSQEMLAFRKTRGIEQ